MGCLFCDLVAGKIPAKVVVDEPDVLAFHDIRPVSPTHVLVIPKQHITSLAHATDAQAALLGRLLSVAQQVARELGLTRGFRVVVNTGEDGGQTVDHLHLHVLGGRPHAWPPG